MSSKLVFNSFFSTLIRRSNGGRRGYAVDAAENAVKVNVPSSSSSTNATVTINKKASIEETISVKEEVFWMRDPKTGYWIPETHFDQVDVVQLRDKLLSNNNINKLQ